MLIITFFLQSAVPGDSVFKLNKIAKLSRWNSIKHHKQSEKEREIFYCQ